MFNVEESIKPTVSGTVHRHTKPKTENIWREIALHLFMVRIAQVQHPSIDTEIIRTNAS